MYTRRVGTYRSANFLLVGDTLVHGFINYLYTKTSTRSHMQASNTQTFISKLR